MADASFIDGTISFSEISGVESLPGDRLLLASDEHGLCVVEDATAQLRSGRVAPGTAVEVDLKDVEDVCFDGVSYAYVLGSHSRNRRGEKKSRRRLGRLRVDGGTFGEPARTDGLWRAIKSHLPAVAAAAKRAPAQCGLNIEGLAFHPDGYLLVGLRSPTITAPDERASKCQEDAVVLRVGHLDDLFRSDAPAKLLKAGSGAAVDEIGGVAQLLDLGGQGIRGLSYDETRDACWILSGLSSDPNHDVEQPWRLWLWEPDGAAPPRPIDRPAAIALAHPEAICALVLDGRPHLLIVEDSAAPEGEVDADRSDPREAGSRYVLIAADDLDPDGAVAPGNRDETRATLPP